MKNNKGFAISSVVYAMLVLFLGLILLILGNLASRKAMFDKEKKDILSRFNTGDNVEEVCSLIEGNLYETGSKYVCDVGDGELKTFYALETNGDNVSLIMNANVDSNGKAITPDNIPDDKGLVAWCGDETLCKTNGDWDNTKGPLTANAALLTRTTGWTKLKNNQITLPSQAQISGAYTGTMPMWLYDYLDSTTNSVPNVYGYWTSTKDATYLSNVITVRYIGQLTYGFVYSDTYCGIRPVITVSKSQIKNPTSTILCKGVTTATAGNVPSGSYNYGDEYTCELGDGEEKTFFVLEKDGDDISLIMNMNVDENGKGTLLGNNVSWCKSGSNNSCGADGALEHLSTSTKSWTKLNQSQITLPSGQQIATAGGDSVWSSSKYGSGFESKTWLHVNLSESHEYWTSTSYSSNNNGAWSVNSYGELGVNDVTDTPLGVRPVIKISSSQIQ